jgi:hypothetical protein
MTRTSTLIAALALCLTAACSKGDGGSPATKVAETPASGTDELFTRWSAMGLDPSQLAKVDGAAYKSQDCQGGKVEGVDVVVCRYADETAAKAAAKAALASIEGDTGAASSNGTLMVVATASGAVDKEGRTIDKLFKALGAK